MQNRGLFGDRREMPGIRIGIAGNDGSWFATFRHGTWPALRELWSIPGIFLLPVQLSSWDPAWRMWLPDERKQSSKIYRSYLPRPPDAAAWSTLPSYKHAIGSLEFILSTGWMLAPRERILRENSIFPWSCCCSFTLNPLLQDYNSERRCKGKKCEYSNTRINTITKRLTSVTIHAEVRSRRNMYISCPKECTECRENVHQDTDSVNWIDAFKSGYVRR